MEAIACMEAPRLSYTYRYYPQALRAWNGWTWRPPSKGSRMVRWVILDPSTLIILDLRLSMHIIVLMDIIYLYVVADYVDLICLYVC